MSAAETELTFLRKAVRDAEDAFIKAARAAESAKRNGEPTYFLQEVTHSAARRLDEAEEEERLYIAYCRRQLEIALGRREQAK